MNKDEARRIARASLPHIEAERSRELARQRDAQEAERLEQLSREEEAVKDAIRHAEISIEIAAKDGKHSTIIKIWKNWDNFTSDWEKRLNVKPIPILRGLPSTLARRHLHPVYQALYDHFVESGFDVSINMSWGDYVMSVQW